MKGNCKRFNCCQPSLHTQGKNKSKECLRKFILEDEGTAIRHLYKIDEEIAISEFISAGSFYFNCASRRNFLSIFMTNILRSYSWPDD